MNQQRVLGSIALCSVLLTVAGCGPAQPRFDLVIRNGTVVDGSGSPGFTADISVTGDRIVVIGDIDEEEGVREIDAAGLVVAPGFIDSHCHSDYTLLVDGTAQSKIPPRCNDRDQRRTNIRRTHQGQSAPRPEPLRNRG